MFHVRFPLLARCLLVFAAAGFVTSHSAAAAPRITTVSVRGLRIGGATTIVIEGSDLAPGARVLLPVPIATERILPGATPEKITVELTLSPHAPPGRVALRIANSRGVSNPIYVGIDDLEEIAFGPEIANLPAALNGHLTGAESIQTHFQGKKGQRIVIDLEARRLGANIDPILALLDPRKVQVAWSQGRTALQGDARLSAILPADGTYTIDLHDTLYRATGLGQFRLKVGSLYYADLAFPLGANRDAPGEFELIGNLPPEAAHVRLPARTEVGDRPIPLPALAGMTGPAPAVHIGDGPEYLAGALPAGPLAVPVAVNGRFLKPREEDVFDLKVLPGKKLHFAVLANRAGSALDGVLTIRNAKGAVLATSDDSPDAVDPMLDFTVPAGVDRLRVGLKDISGRSGPTFVYRVAVTPADEPDFRLQITDDRVNVPDGGVGIVRVHAERRGYAGDIKLSLPGSPGLITIENAVIPGGTTDTLLVLRTAAGGSRPQKNMEIIGEGQVGSSVIRRAALRPDSIQTHEQPWLKSELACAVIDTALFSLQLVGEPRLALGTQYRAQVEAIRQPGGTGPIRLTFLTSQLIPKTAPPQSKDDIAKAIRLDGMPVVAANESRANVSIIVPSDLPTIDYDIAIKGELLSSDGMKVLATAYTPARRLHATQPFALEVAGKAPVKARSGGGSTGIIMGKIVRSGGFDKPVTLTLTGLPPDLPAPSVTVAGNRSEFALPVSFPYESKLGPLAGVKLVATGAGEGNAVVKSNEVPIAVEVVAGEPPPPAPALYRVFEDESGFPAILNEGGGQVSLETADRYAGTAALRIAGDQRFRAKMPGWGFTIAEKPGPGQFRYLRFAWRKQGGNNIALQLNANNQWGPLRGQKGPAFRYEAGPAVNTFNAAAIRIDTHLPEDWVMVTRDLFADFGSFKLTGMAFTPGAGGYGLFDHVYLARTIDDLKGCPAPILPQKPLTIFEDQPSFVANLNEGGGTAQLEMTDRYSGKSSVKITPDQRFNEKLPGLRVKIVEHPGPGEFRFLRYAWKKKGGSAICLQLNHDGQWGPTPTAAGKFRYFAGAGPEPYGAALQLENMIPGEWVVETRDLFADFGAFTLTGLALSAIDGDYALFDHIYLGQSVRDFELARPAVEEKAKK
ncbi:MAG TPA: hypothetical protein VGP68_21580 [Gemmataceae bacterium]|jgi:hypothetical protein|nr:hypothetical protein [Gemmataceae bacterium]